MITVTCISLASQTDRRAHMTAQLQQCGLPFRFFDAIRIDPAAPPPVSYDRQRRLKHSGVPMRAGEMGCYLSHQQVWRDFLAGGEQLCLVLEDDVTVLPDFAPVVQSLIEVSAQWEFVRLYGVYPRPSVAIQPLACARQLVDYLDQPNGTQGYLINRDAAMRLLDYTARMWLAIDMSIDRDWEHGVRIMGIEPAVLSLDEDFATTLGAVDKPRLSWQGKLAREYHRFGDNLRKQIWLMRKRRLLRRRGAP
ncbi:MAG: glycosyltransferase family 25 protein [Pseudomonadota bacterium]|nr:glycosyltransferase family 25 protein [Pseudomonadota bacterium]